MMSSSHSRVLALKHSVRAESDGLVDLRGLLVNPHELGQRVGQGGLERRLLGDRLVGDVLGEALHLLGAANVGHRHEVREHVLVGVNRREGLTEGGGSDGENLLGGLCQGLLHRGLRGIPQLIGIELKVARLGHERRVRAIRLRDNATVVVGDRALHAGGAHVETHQSHIRLLSNRNDNRLGAFVCVFT